jgi:type IV fimbrial biogenesis protein FimT
MRPQRGVTLVELVIGVAITSILLALGLPSFSLWIQNTQNRTAAESILNGLQLARAEAVKRNTLVRFDLTDDTGLIAWRVGCERVTADCPASIQSRVATEGSVNARVGISTVEIPTPIPVGYFNTAIAAGTDLTAGVSFNSMGRASAGTDMARIDVTNAVTNAARRFVVFIGTGGQIRMCDPAVVLAANSQGCS